MGLTIISEELNPETNDETQDMWNIDPLDGTTAYLMKAGTNKCGAGLIDTVRKFATRLAPQAASGLIHGS